MADEPDILSPLTPAARGAHRHKLSHGLRAGHRHAVMTAPNGDSLPPEGSPPDVAISARRTTGVDFPSRLQFTLECCAALRRAELTAVTWDNLVFTADGGLRVLIPRAKGDPEGEGAWISIPRGDRKHTCPVLALEAWREATRCGSLSPDREMSPGLDQPPRAIHPRHATVRHRRPAPDPPASAGRLAPPQLPGQFAVPSPRTVGESDNRKTQCRRRILPRRRT
jgi:hypothetical protein